MDAPELVGLARRYSGHSVRRLAADADIAGSTITRIQSGRVDPSVGTLAQILEAAGLELHLVVAPRGRSAPTIGDLAGAWRRHLRDGSVRLDWPRWRGFIDALALHPDRVADAIYPSPPPSGEAIIDNALAGVAEKLADDAHLPRPAWATAVPILDEPYSSPLVRGVHRDVPPQLRARGLMIDAESLWRRSGTIGV